MHIIFLYYEKQTPKTSFSVRGKQTGEQNPPARGKGGQFAGIEAESSFLFVSLCFPYQSIFLGVARVTGSYAGTAGSEPDIW